MNLNGNLECWSAGVPGERPNAPLVFHHSITASLHHSICA